MTLHLGLVQTCVFEDKLILAFDKKWLEMNSGKPLEFEIILEKNQLTLSADLVGGDKVNSSTGELTK